jgi:hypothetical protein
MKKTYLLLSAALIASSSFAQLVEKAGDLITPGQPLMHETISSEGISKALQNSDKAQIGNWYDYAFAYENLYASTPYGLIGNNLFPDSTILVDYSTSFGAPWVHAVGQTFDVDALPFVVEGIALDPSQPFTVDSIAAYGVYTRVNSSIDTLILQVIAPSANNLGGRSFFLDSPSPGDTLFMINTDWDFASLSTPGVMTEYRVIMDDAFFADSTANGLHIPTIVAGDVISPATGAFAGVFAINMEFRPGYTYTATDTLNVNKNGWRFLSNELNGQDTDPTYTADDYNAGSILPISVRYNENGSGWNDSFIPHWAYTNTFGYEAMAINAFITGEESTISVNEVNNNFKFNVFPNPSNGVFNINLSSNDDNNVNLTVKNVVGQTVLTETVNVSGNTNHAISLNDYSKGIYFLTIGNETVKLIVE